MLPVRNGAIDLSGHLESVGRFADAVVALDDGSTDDTRAILEAHPLVHTVLTNPRRDSYRGWNDSENRNRLLDAALELKPSWAMSLDADELIPADDAEALRGFLAGEADPESAYLFRVLKMMDDLGHHAGSPLWVGRLFAPRPGHRFASDHLHFVPIPTAITRDRWVKTTLRIQHLGSLNGPRRQARLAKYREADPDHRWQRSYDHLLDEPGLVRTWTPRSRLLPVVAHQPVIDEVEVPAGQPVMSVVIISRDEEAIIERAVAAALAQDLDDPFEVIVVTSGSDRTADLVAANHPEVTVIALDRPVLPGGGRGGRAAGAVAGWRSARGRWITFPGSHVELRPGSLAARLAAHRWGWPMVTETMLNGTDTRAGWASWFLDNAGLLPGRPSFAFESAPPRCSYHRDLLDEVGGFPEDMRAGEDTVVNEELFDRGYGAWREDTCVTVHHSPCSTAAILARHHAKRGRARARILLDARARGEITTRHMVGTALRWFPGRMRWTHMEVRRWGSDVRGQYRRSLPWIALGATSAWGACGIELLRSAGCPPMVKARPGSARWWSPRAGGRRTT